MGIKIQVVKETLREPDLANIVSLFPGKNAPKTSKIWGKYFIIFIKRIIFLLNFDVVIKIANEGRKLIENESFLCGE